MTGDNLARIERVENLRAAWPDEARDFTPWLAENLDELGDALGVELDLQGREVQVGSRFLDILATERYDGRPVVIENQLDTTDNDHLSRLLIYSAGFDAQKVIWVASDIDDEHRQLLDWLNQRTDENTQFYGVVVELWKIDNSRAAPHFKVVVAPNEWQKRNGGTGKQPTGRERQNIEFRHPLAERIKPKIGKSVVTDPATRGHWCVIGDALPGVKGTTFWQKGLNFEVTVKKSGAQGRGWNRKACQLLSERRGTIESQIDPLGSESWDWQIGDDSAKVIVSRPGNIYDNPESWDEYHDWIIAKFFKFKEVFTPLLAELAAAAGE